MTMSTETPKTNEKSTILRELDELMEYMDTNDAQETEELIDPAFFIGNMNDNTSDVPTLTTIADELIPEQKKEETPKQPGLFSARVEHFKQRETTAEQFKEIPDSPEAEQPIPQEFAEIADALVAENMPKIEAQLREKIMAYLQGKKSS